MHFYEWLCSLHSSLGLKVSESEDFRSILPSLPLSMSSLLGLGALASITAYWLVTRPRPMRPTVDLQAQSVAVNVSTVIRIDIKDKKWIDNIIVHQRFVTEFSM